MIWDGRQAGTTLLWPEITKALDIMGVEADQWLSANSLIRGIYVERGRIAAL